MAHLQHPFAPVPVDDILMAFPAAIEHLMPVEDDIPAEFWDRNNPWADIIWAWFSVGLNADVEFHMQEGIDGETMYRHMTCVLRSYRYPHEYKAAAAAFLLSTWCKEVAKWQKQPTS